MKNFLKALLVCGLVTLTGVLLDRILRSGGIPGRYLLDLSNLLTGAFAGALFYYATREQAGKQKLVEEKLPVIADMRTPALGRQSTRMSRLSNSAHTSCELGMSTATVPPRRAASRGAFTRQPR